DERELATARRSFLAVVKRAENTGMIWDGDITVHTNWGTAPTLLHPLRLTLTIGGGDSLHLYPLDSLGQADGYFPFYPDVDGAFRIDIDQRTMRTPWFGIERFFGPTTESKPMNPPTAFDVALFPNPVGTGSLNVRVHVPTATPLRLDVFDILGRKLRSFDVDLAPGTRTLSIPVAGLEPGTYMLAGRTRVGITTEMFTVSRSAASFHNP
ncbi:MAG: T9SS type A sorting domain-containing protein, partial [Chlorobi bacterium]|nr:T9SS type A sorting domain-containing protein [Chlorobiota bacterium]